LIARPFVAAESYPSSAVIAAEFRQRKQKVDDNYGSLANDRPDHVIAMQSAPLVTRAYLNDLRAAKLVPRTAWQQEALTYSGKERRQHYWNDVIAAHQEATNSYRLLSSHLSSAPLRTRALEIRAQRAIYSIDSVSTNDVLHDGGTRLLELLQQRSYAVARTKRRYE
jgi:hypothetical protein